MNDNFRDLLAQYLPYAGPAAISETSVLRDLGLDSMRSVELLFAIEDTYGVTVPDRLLVNQTFYTAGSLWDAVSSLLPEALS
ncbi:phosphopantetheine-binding protein [Streptomyces sp. 7N604]|uniref:phosphopantetheine-binding protein n=1 Tax=Streptomyces sp. 7N604 TaxID=3457415 RepID=UPI003FD1C4FE